MTNKEYFDVTEYHDLITKDLNLDSVKTKSWRSVELMQYLDKLPYDFATFKDKVNQFIGSHNSSYALYIIHDKDSNDDEKGQHVHCLLFFASPVPFTSLITHFNIRQNYFRKIKSKKLAIKYLIHANDKTKKQFDSDDITYLNCKKDDFDFESDIINFDEHTLLYYQEKYFNDVSKLKSIEYQYKVYLNIQAKRKVDRDMQVIYISGGSGTGKTLSAKLMLNLMGYTNDEIFISSSSNDILDGYSGEKTILLDDFRDSNMQLSDVLKMLDNHTNSSVKSRYNNKQLCRCELIIITSIIPLEYIYNGVKNDESLYQLYRRITTYIKVIKQNNKLNDERTLLRFYQFDKESFLDFPYSKYDEKDITQRINSICATLQQSMTDKISNLDW